MPDGDFDSWYKSDGSEYQLKQRAINIFGEVLKEVERARKKHPVWPKDPIHAAAIVCEKSGELIRAALQYKYEGCELQNMYKEAIHKAAMAIRFLVDVPIN